MFDPKPKGETRPSQAPFPQSFEWSLLHSSYWIFVCISCLFGRAFHQVFSLCRSSLRYDRNSGLFLNQTQIPKYFWHNQPKISYSHDSKLKNLNLNSTNSATE